MLVFREAGPSPTFPSQWAPKRFARERRMARLFAGSKLTDSGVTFTRKEKGPTDEKGYVCDDLV